MESFAVWPIGWVDSPLRELADAPRQADEGAPSADLVFADGYAPALDGLAPGAEVLVLTWLDRARRDLLRVHPRDDRAADPRGVFATRSADRPNPIGLHPARVLAVEGTRVRLDRLEAVHGTPVLDLKPVLVPPGLR